MNQAYIYCYLNTQSIVYDPFIVVCCPFFRFVVAHHDGVLRQLFEETASLSGLHTTNGYEPRGIEAVCQYVKLTIVEWRSQPMDSLKYAHLEVKVQSTRLAGGEGEYENGTEEEPSWGA